MKCNEKVINESGKVSTYFQSHAEVSHKFISTGLWPGDHKSSFFLFFYSQKPLTPLQSRWVYTSLPVSYVTSLAPIVYCRRRQSFQNFNEPLPNSIGQNGDV